MWLLIMQARPYVRQLGIQLLVSQIHVYKLQHTLASCSPLQFWYNKEKKAY